MVYKNRLNITKTIKISLYYVGDLDENGNQVLTQCVYVDNQLTTSEQDYEGEYQVSAYFWINEQNFRFVFGEDPEFIVYATNEDTEDERLDEREVSEIFMCEKKALSEEDYILHHNHFETCELAPLQLQYELDWD